MGIFRIEQSSVKAGFVAEEEKALGVGIEPAQRIDIFRKSKLGQGPVGRAVGRELGENSIRLMEGEEHGRLLEKLRTDTFGKIIGRSWIIAVPVFDDCLQGTVSSLRIGDRTCPLCG